MGLVEYVILRIVRTDHDPGPDTRYPIGTFTDPFWWDTYAQADKRVILQYNNETNWWDDDTFFVGLMQTADRWGRKVIIYNDSVGATTDDMWFRRKNSLTYAREHGHYVGLHAYGDVSDGRYHPMTAWDSPGAWRWYAGRYEHLYALMPELQPMLILDECGAGGVQLAAGYANWTRDWQAMEHIAATQSYLKSFNWWTAGGAGNYGFKDDCLDGYLSVMTSV